VPTPTPTATPTGEPEEPTPTPTPTPFPTSPPPVEIPPPPTGPVTDILPGAPKIVDLVGGIPLVTPMGCGISQDLLEIQFHYNDLTPFVLGGKLFREHPDSPIFARFMLTIDEPPFVTQINYLYTYSGGESADVTYRFCVDPIGTLDPDFLAFNVWIRDADGNPSNILPYVIPTPTPTP
jgi:hypothetical protein